MADELNSLKGTLTKKIGPLPGWAWAGILAAGGIYLLKRQRKASGMGLGGLPILGTGNGSGAISGGGGAGSGITIPPSPIASTPVAPADPGVPVTPVPSYAAPPSMGQPAAPIQTPWFSPPPTLLDPIYQRGANTSDALWGGLTDLQRQLAATYQFGGSQLAPRFDNVVMLGQMGQTQLLSRSAPGVGSMGPGGQMTYYRPSAPLGNAASLLSGGYGGAPSGAPGGGSGVYNLALAQAQWGPGITNTAQLSSSQLQQLAAMPGGHS